MTTIRIATKVDVPQIYAFIRALAEYEHVSPDNLHVTREGIERDCFGENPYYYCLLAEHDGKPAGFAIYLFNYSTFEGRPSLHVEDLFVVPELRGQGIGKALLARAAAIACGVGSLRLQWEVLDWNQPAIEFYESLGARFGDVWRNMRLTGEAVGRLAALAEYAQEEAAA
jgi:GNAT superfamily N-acetyltransferase